MAPGATTTASEPAAYTNGRGGAADSEPITKPLYDERDMKIICIGAGASGLVFAYKLQRSFEKFSLTIYEKNTELSGTWFENRYPGCACDVAAHNYTYSFEPKPDWSSVYASSKEIYGYFNDFADKYNLRPYVKTQKQVVSARWVPERGGWIVGVKDLVSGEVFEDFCHILVNAGGILNAWKWPSIPGFEDFKGPKLHTAAWDDSVDVDNKTVGLIGNGSSGVQVLPAIYPRVKKIVHFIRKGTWVAPPLRGLSQHVYTPEELDRFANEPGFLLEHRKKYQTSTSGVFNLFIRGSQTQKDVRASMEKHMTERIQDPVLRERLIPHWSVGCRRLTPGIKYLEALQTDKVDVIMSGIKEITPTGTRTVDGHQQDFDVLLCATGFDVSFRPRFPLLGQGGEDLRELWSKEALGYLGLAAPQMPNYFAFLGPNCPIGNGPILIAIEAQADYILKWCDRWQTENIRSFTPKWDAIKDFNAHSDQFMRNTVWTEDCSSWYKGNSVTGRVSALWPGSTLHYLEVLSQIRSDDWDVEYNGNRFSFLGNGFSQTELDPTSDWAFYIKEHDDSPFIAKSKQRRIINKSGSKAGTEFKVI
ncbi:Cyclohexanone monooxygenase [Pleurostoma richardsiae]|uniref:Cyclohexanone monooxygenase n=1 Tax=Pleurostoma richardsiae TaxID=41990 RepID=A0AA38VQK0_9PEZI|nr:Cyclohexanone monooxygenase [Pleurostoma richardsiae]